MRTRVALTVVALLALSACGSPPPTVGAQDAEQLASPAPTASLPSVPVQAGTLPSAPAEAAVRPARLKIDALGLTATVDAVGIDAKTNDFAVPPSIDRVGWYRFGPGLDAAGGSIVIAGHVDSADQGKGAFYKLRDMAPGDTATVTGTDGATRTFRVVAREIYPKASIPLDRYFARDGALRLVLITCGGPFDEKTRHYRDNVVVTAAVV